MTRRRGAGRGRGAAGRGPSQRQLRVGEEVRHALARVLARGELSDPALDGQSVTVTEVRMSPDLRNATAFVTPLGGSGAAAVVKALNRAGGYFRGQLAHEVDLRYAPSVRFSADRSFEEASRVEALLHDPAVARDLEPGTGGPAARGEDDDDGA